MANINITVDTRRNTVMNIISSNTLFNATIASGSRGKSAYEIWIGEGYVGSEEDFLQWLRIQTAAETTLVDIGDHYNSTNLEDVLQEVAEMIAATIDKHYVHRQETSSSTWVIYHNLNKYPSVRTYDRYSKELIGEIVFNDLNRVTINFSGATSGVAYLN